MTVAESKANFGDIYQEDIDFPLAVDRTFDAPKIIIGGREAIEATFGAGMTANITFIAGKEINRSSTLTLGWTEGKVSLVVYNMFERPTPLLSEITTFGPRGELVRLNNYSDPTYQVIPNDPELKDWLLTYGERKIVKRTTFDASLRGSDQSRFRVRMSLVKARPVTYLTFYFNKDQVIGWKGLLGLGQITLTDLDPNKPDEYMKRFEAYGKRFLLDLNGLKNSSSPSLTLSIAQGLP